MKQRIQSLVEAAVAVLKQDGTLAAGTPVQVQVERTRDPQHGDFATNVAMTLAKTAGRKPRELAAAIVAALPQADPIDRVEIAGPGFINFFLSPTAYQQVVSQILARGEAYGRSSVGAGVKVQLEFVSANPTGPLHVGHGRGAAYGAALANLLEAADYQVHREYYVNDTGRQMDILAVSVWLRYLEAQGQAVPFPANGYRGDYVREIAAQLAHRHGDVLVQPATQVSADLPPDTEQGGDKERHIDALIQRARALLGETHYATVFQLALDNIIADICEDLADFGVVYDEWFSERSLTTSGTVQRFLQRLQEQGHTYEADGALWFRATDFGDEKDRVLVRDNGQPTYFAADIAYHMNKLERGFDQLIDVWGADHHGYVSRVKAALAALGEDNERLEVLLVQFAILYRSGERLPMSTRGGEFVTLRQLRTEVGNDAARFFYVMRKCEQHLDFDLDLATSQSNENPVYYCQYAHARICSVFRQLEDKGLPRDVQQGEAHLHRLTAGHERALLATLARYPEVVESAAVNREPHQLAHYLRELANDFHTYYNAHTFLVDDHALRDARLNLTSATRQVIAQGLGLLGVSAPETM